MIDYELPPDFDEEPEESTNGSRVVAISIIGTIVMMIIYGFVIYSCS